MKISFLVTFYNQEEFVDRCINSILNVDKPCDWEILIGDDGSKDNTVERVNRYINDYPNNIFLYVNKENKNKDINSVIYASLNRLRLLNMSSGDYFCIVDGDDFYCDKEFISIALSKFNEYKDLSIVAYNFNIYYSDKKINEIITFKKEQIINTKYYIRKMYTHSGACVFKNYKSKENIEKLFNLASFDDNDIVLNSLNYGKMYSVNRTIYSYFQNSVSIYNSINMMQKSILNIFGMESNILMLKKEYELSIIRRYSSFLIYLFLKRREIYNYDVNKKYYDSLLNYYESKDSFLNSVIDFDTLVNRDKVKVFKTICIAFLLNPISLFKIIFGDV